MRPAYGPPAHRRGAALLLRALGPGTALAAGDPAAGKGQHQGGLIKQHSLDDTQMRIILNTPCASRLARSGLVSAVDVMDRIVDNSQVFRKFNLS